MRVRDDDERETIDVQPPQAAIDRQWVGPGVDEDGSESGPARTTVASPWPTSQVTIEPSVRRPTGLWRADEAKAEANRQSGDDHRLVGDAPQSVSDQR